MNDVKPTNFHLLIYSFIALPLAFAGIPLYLHAPDFYATQYHVSLSLLAAILFAARLFDAVQDPFIGHLCDKHRALTVPFFIGALVTFALGFYALFHPVPAYAGLWLLISLFIVTTAFSALTILLSSLGGAWSDHSHQRTRITVARESFTLLGIATASALPSFLQRELSASAAFHYISLGLMVCLACTALAFIYWYKASQIHSRWAASEERPTQTHFFKIPRLMHGFFAAYGLSILASTVPAVLVIFYIRDFLGAGADSGFLLAVYFIAAIIGMPLWLRISKHTGKARAWFFAIMLAIASFAGTFFLHAGDTTPYAFICIASGLAFGAELALPPALLADLIAYKNDHAQTASRFALLSFLGKAALALASVLVLPALDLAGFAPAGGNTDHALATLGLLYGPLPCAIKTAALYLLWRWINTNGDNHEKILPPSRPGMSHAA